MKHTSHHHHCLPAISLSRSQPIKREHYQLFHQQLQPLGCNLINGMIPAGLRKLLERWDPADAQNPGSSVPRVLYTIPNGGNPTGASVTCERKQEVYELASKFDLLIIEDISCSSRKLRMGLVTGPKPLVDRVVMHTSTFTRLMVSQLLHSWGPEGFLKHVDGVMEFYRSQRNAMLSSADQWLKDFQETGWSYQGCHVSG